MWPCATALTDLVASFARPGWSDAQIISITGGGVLVALSVAYVFYLGVERPFMTTYRRRGDAESLRSADVREIPDADGLPGGARTGD